MFTIVSCFHRKTRVKTFHFKHDKNFRKVSNAEKWISSEEAHSQISFLSVLRIKTTRNAAVPTPPPIDNPTESRSPNGQSQSRLLSAFSPFNQEGEPDVTAYADVVVQRMERTQEDVPEVVQQSVDIIPRGAQGHQSSTLEVGSSGIRRSSTFILPAGEDDTEADLSALESAFKVAIDPDSQLPELLTTIGSNPESTVLVPAATDDDNVSSVCDIPLLQGGQPRVHFLGSQGEAERSDEDFKIDRSELYGQNTVDSESRTEGGPQRRREED